MAQRSLHLIVTGGHEFPDCAVHYSTYSVHAPNLDKPWLSHIRPHHGIWVTLRWQIRLILWAEVELGIFGRPSRPKTTSEKQGPCLGSCSRTSDELVSVGWGGHAQYVEGKMVMGLVISPCEVPVRADVQERVYRERYNGPTWIW